MIGALVASFPRKPRLHLQAQRRDGHLVDTIGLVSRCQKVCAMARGPGYLASEHLSVYDAATSYFAGLTALYIFNWRQARLYFGECLTMTKTLGLHKPQEAYTHLGRLPAALGSQNVDQESSRNRAMDNITIEMGRRIFWTLFVTIRSLQQESNAFHEIVIAPQNPSNPGPPLPSEVDDFCIYPTHNEIQPNNYPSLITASNARVRVYTSYRSLTTMDSAWGSDAIVDWERQSRVLYDSLRRCRESTNALLAEASSRTTSLQPPMPRDPAWSLLNLNLGQQNESQQAPEQRRQTGEEIQKANLLVSSLSTRYYIVDRYWRLRDAYQQTASTNQSSKSRSPGTSVTSAGLESLTDNQASPNHEVVEQEIRKEIETITREVVGALGNLRQINMEPSADNFVGTLLEDVLGIADYSQAMKLRSLAGALLDTPEWRKGHTLTNVQNDLSAFLNDIVILERAEGINGTTDQGDDEALYQRTWTDLRQRQASLSQLSGY